MRSVVPEQVSWLEKSWSRRRRAAVRWKDHNPFINPRPVDHHAALESVRFLTRSQYQMHRPDAFLVDPCDLMAALNNAVVSFVLIGQHGISGWLSSPRATRDVDAVVADADFQRAISTIEDKWRLLTVVDVPIACRFLDPTDGQAVIDLFRPIGLLRDVFANCVHVDCRYNVPNLEMALAAKFGAMRSPDRDLPQRYADAGNFAEMVTRNHARIDFDRLRRLGDAVYPGGGDEILRFVEDVKAGRMLRL